VRATANAMKSARRLRRQLSLPEMLLWQRLRLTRGELRIRRQHAIGSYVADFYCPTAKLVIEVDGAAHDDRQAANRKRDEYMELLGIRVIRFPATAVLANPDEVADAIYRACSASAGPSTTQLR
jgi:very-short-patch-repair endonuclease